MSIYSSHICFGPTWIDCNHNDFQLRKIERKSPTLGKKPRNFTIDPTGSYLLAANQESDNIAVFRIDRAGGGLTAVGQPFSVPRPVCLLMAQSPSSRR